MTTGETPNNVIGMIIKSTEVVETVSADAPDAGEVQPGRKSPLPEDFPAKPLGVDVTGKFNHFLTAIGQHVWLDPRQLSRNHIVQLVAPSEHVLYEHWPRRNAEGEINGFRAEKAAEALMAASAMVGVFDATERVRGAGGWRGRKGELVFHCGDAVLAGDRWCKPGVYDGFIYPAAPRGPRPSPTWAPGGKDGPAHELLATLRTWNWRNPEVDAYLLLGWIGAGMLGGALDWRPMAWITGDRATGKSTLHKLLRYIFGDAILSVSDATAAGIWQKSGHSSLPVAFDELEAEADNRQAAGIIKLARQSASGGVVLRGGADHKGSEFTARSAILFSSILMPPLPAQDRSRMTILELDRLQTPTPPQLEPQFFNHLGTGLRRRLVTGWQRFDETLELYRMALATNGHGGRSADQIGTLLACADLLLHDSVPAGVELEEWASKFKNEKSNFADVAELDEEADQERCLTHLLTSPIEVYRGGARDVMGAWIDRAAGHTSGDQGEARNVLLNYGLKLCVSNDGLRWLAVANSHQGLAQLFCNTHWAARSGTAGVWSQALRRVDGARKSKGSIWFRSVKQRVVLIPLDRVSRPGSPGDDGNAPGQLPFDRVEYDPR